MDQGALENRRVVLGVSGGVAAYKAAGLARLLTLAGAAVDTVLTAAGARFVGAATFQALTGRPVHDDLWSPAGNDGMAHIHLTRGADACLIAPASADVIAKMAQGCADDLLSTLVLARDCPLLVAPSMNGRMWDNPATQRNVRALLDDGAVFLGPDCGIQACGETGYGRLLEPEAIVDALCAFWTPKVLAGKRVVLTAGPTFEAIDPVRGLTNLSSGRMGFALARACADAGAQVCLVAGPVHQPTPYGVERVDVVSAQQMHDAVMAALAATRCDIFIGVAAVADYRPQTYAAQKIKKTGQARTLPLVPNTDILAQVAARPNAPLCVGFAAESEDVERHAQTKLQAKNLALVVGNLVQEGLGGPRNTIVLVDRQGSTRLPPDDKLNLARKIVAHIAQLQRERT
jgi:phosphopantothenoylcysteine decarboxylase/phosphopantothenate--cysteine ligase